MGSLKSRREKRLQKKLIPVNIVVCIIALVAALSLFLAPIIKVDFGKILRDERIMEFVDDKIDGAVGGDLEDSEQEGINYKPVITMLVKNILGKAEGKIAISASSGFKVLTAGDNKTQKVLDDLFFGKKALATNLINSVVDGIANMFETNEGKAVLEEALVSTLTSQILKNVDDDEVAEAVAKNVKDFVEIFHELGDPDKVPDGKVDGVVNKLIDKVDDLLGDGVEISEESRQEFIDQIQEIYDSTKGELKDGETVSIETIICVTISKNVDLSQINLSELFDNILPSDDDSENEETSLHIAAVDEEIGDTEGVEDEDSDKVPGEEEDPEGEGSENEPSGGEGNEGEESKNKIVTNYNDMLLEMGFDQNAKEALKEKMRTTLNNGLTNLIEKNNIDNYLGYYGYVFYAMLVFIVPWVILFLFSLFHMFARNKRFTMWYVKLFCWFPAVIWLVLTLFPVVAPKVSFLNDFWNGESGPLVQALFNGVSSMTWISGLCYVLLWLVSIFWAFPIKHKIRKERKNPDAKELRDAEEDIEY